MPANPGDYPGLAAADLGLGNLLGQQVQDETEEQRKKRLAMQQQRGLIDPAMQNSASSMLFGDAGGY